MKSVIQYLCIMGIILCSFGSLNAVHSDSGNSKSVSTFETPQSQGIYAMFTKGKTAVKRFLKKTIDENKQHRNKLILAIAITLILAFVLFNALAFVAIILGYGGVATALTLFVLILAFVVPLAGSIAMIAKFLRNYYKKIGKTVSRKLIFWRSWLIVFLASLSYYALVFLISWLIP